jgi:hypothetical protein
LDLILLLPHREKYHSVTTAVEEGIDMLERLCAKLTDIPTPAGPTPREINTAAHGELSALCKV